MKPDIRELTLKHGVKYASDTELLMLMLGSGIKNVPVEKLASMVMNKIAVSTNDNLVDKLLTIKGMGESKALSVAASCEFGRRRNLHNNALILHPSDIIPFVRSYSIYPKEHFLCVTLNGGHEIIEIHVVSIGTVNRALVHPREVFSQALIDNASAVIVAHNHPSGNCEPSREDIETTKILYDCSQVLGIELLDHVIFDKSSYYSFMEHDLLFKEIRVS